MPLENGTLVPGDEGYVAPAPSTEPVIQVPENTVIDLDARVPQPGDVDYVDPAYVRPMDQVNPDPELETAKADYTEAYQQWVAMSAEEQATGEGQELKTKLDTLYTFIQGNAQPPSDNVPPTDVAAVPEQKPLGDDVAPDAIGAVDTRTPPVIIQQDGNVNKPRAEGLTDEHFTNKHDDPTQADIPGEQTVDILGKPAGFNEFYKGSHDVNPDNPLLQHLSSEDFDRNKYQENR